AGPAVRGALLFSDGPVHRIALLGLKKGARASGRLRELRGSVTVEVLAGPSGRRVTVSTPFALKDVSLAPDPRSLSPYGAGFNPYEGYVRPIMLTTPPPPRPLPPEERLNAALRGLPDRPGRGAALDAKLLGRLNVMRDKGGADLGLLRKGDKLEWPLPLQDP